MELRRGCWKSPFACAAGTWQVVCWSGAELGPSGERALAKWSLFSSERLERRSTGCKQGGGRWPGDSMACLWWPFLCFSELTVF